MQSEYIGQEAHDVFSTRQGTSDEILIDDKWLLGNLGPHVNRTSAII